ncbi:alpha/beta hydrolase [Streptomyces sp. SM1P]
MREAERAHLGERIPQNATPAQREAWWDGLSPEERERYIELVPERIGNLDGIPVLARDAANRRNLPALIDKLEGVDTDKARDQLAGLREIERQLNENGKPPMYLIGVGDEGNGRAIVSFGNPDVSQHVSAYVPGLNTSLDEEFAKNDLGRARDTAIGAQGYDESTASIVWLGYDAPQLPDKDGVAGYFAVMGTGRAEKGGAAYRDFMGGISVTNQNKDPHLTAIGHSYGSRTVGAAAARPGDSRGRRHHPRRQSGGRRRPCRGPRRRQRARLRGGRRQRPGDQAALEDPGRGGRARAGPGRARRGVRRRRSRRSG